MIQVLRSKNVATRFQILVEIALSQPRINQRDIAQKLEVTPQAISDYIKELLREGLLASEGRARYRLTKEGVDWFVSMARQLRNYLTSVGQAINNISVCTAIAAGDLSEGQPVGLAMKDGLLFATALIGNGAGGVTVSPARKGQDVGVANVTGVIELEMGTVTVCKVPGIERGGSQNVDLVCLRTKVEGSRLVGAIGLEALVILRRIGVEPGYFYGVTEAVIEAAHCGQSSLVVAVDTETPGLLKRLEEEALDHEILDLRIDSAAQ